MSRSGIGAVVVLLDPAQFEPESDETAAEAQRQRTRAVRHALSEFEIPTYVIRPQQALAEALAR